MQCQMAPAWGLLALIAANWDEKHLLSKIVLQMYKKLYLNIRDILIYIYIHIDMHIYLYICIYILDVQARLRRAITISGSRWLHYFVLQYVFPLQHMGKYSLVCWVIFVF